MPRLQLPLPLLRPAQAPLPKLREHLLCLVRGKQGLPQIAGLRDPAEGLRPLLHHPQPARDAPENLVFRAAKAIEEQHPDLGLGFRAGDPRGASSLGAVTPQAAGDDKGRVQAR